ncbi:hypothetical protein ElyMa_000606100 [Elysia marginata]|uniref:Uncharacterized protein n=1 Tax=Elysia marginata TaxID=1093978 RepID=A0AAV4G910_9GAST|nr:hypothetical protein ElyMa_000606100 [Elysia marginata]
MLSRLLGGITQTVTQTKAEVFCVHVHDLNKCIDSKPEICRAKVQNHQTSASQLYSQSYCYLDSILTLNQQTLLVPYTGLRTTGARGESEQILKVKLINKKEKKWGKEKHEGGKKKQKKKKKKNNNNNKNNKKKKNSAREILVTLIKRLVLILSQLKNLSCS